VDRVISRGTAVINQLRAFLLERDMIFAKTPAKLRTAMPEILENAEANLKPRTRNLVGLLWGERKELEEQIVAVNIEIEQIACTDATCQRLRQIPAKGPLIATAVLAAIGNGAALHKGASWHHGLVLSQGSIGQAARRGCSAPASVATAIETGFVRE
jgi:transposase